jgi:hypothetical protein
LARSQPYLQDAGFVFDEQPNRLSADAPLPREITYRKVRLERCIRR